MLVNPVIVRSLTGSVTGVVRGSSYRLFQGYIYLFALTLALQTGHMLEHVVQVIQKFVLGSSNAHGLIGRLDIEWVHFGFNTAYFVLLLPLVWGWLAYRREIGLLGRRWTGLTVVCLVTLLIQSYHQVEHSVKLVQFLHNNMQGTLGILGANFDLVLLHFTINALVYLPLVILFFGAGFHKRLLPKRAG